MVTGTHRLGEITTRTGLTPDALRFYERLGLLPRYRRTADDPGDLDARRLVIEIAARIRLARAVRRAIWTSRLCSWTLRG